MLDDTIKEFNSLFEGLQINNWEPRPPYWETLFNELYSKYFFNGNVATDLYFKTTENIKKTLYELNNQNSQIAFIREIINLFHEYENLFHNDENTEIRNDVWIHERHEFSEETIPDYYKYVSDLYHLYISFMGDIHELCFLFSIDLDTIINEHKKRWEKPPTPPIIWKNASEITDTQPGTLPPQTKVKAFWKQSKKSLKKFHSLLQNNYKFIDEIKQDVFISHFDGTFTPGTPKINWNDEQTVFVRLFDTINFCFDKKYLHTTDKTVSVAELSKHFTINGAKTDSKKLRQTRNTIKGIETKMELEIKNISKNLQKTFSTVD